MRFLLVHGTTQSPDGWQPLIEALSAIGHHALTTDLASFGDQASPRQYGDAVAAELSGANVDAVVAHSGSGLLLPAIASATQAAAQVYLAAFIPNGSQSLMDEVNDPAAEVFHADWIGVDPTSDHDAARHFLFHDCSPAVTEWALTTLRSFVPATAYAQHVPTAPIPAVSIVPDGDRTLRPEWMLAASRERLDTEAIVVKGGHCPHISRPNEIARHLASAL